MKFNTLILSDVFQKFVRKKVIDFGLDPYYNASLPGSTWQYEVKKDAKRL